MIKEESKAAFTRETKGESNRDKTSLDFFWLKDESLEDSANLPAPDIIADEIVDDLEAVLEQFAEIAEDLGERHVRQKKAETLDG